MLCPIRDCNEMFSLSLQSKTTICYHLWSTVIENKCTLYSGIQIVAFLSHKWLDKMDQNNTTSAQHVIYVISNTYIFVVWTVNYCSFSPKWIHFIDTQSQLTINSSVLSGHQTIELHLTYVTSATSKLLTPHFPKWQRGLQSPLPRQFK